MFPVGHLSVAFIISYLLIRKFSVHGISIPLVMFLSIIPDIDIFLQSAGIGSHRTMTHSAIIFTILASILIAKYGKPALIYSFAYLQHIVIGDIIVGPINLLYPFGNFSVDLGIKYSSLLHMMLELLLSICMLAVILYYADRSSPSSYIFKFAYRIIDPLIYSILIVSLLVSLIYIIYENQYLLSEFIESQSRLYLFILSNTIGIISIVLLLLCQNRYQHTARKIFSNIL